MRLRRIPASPQTADEDSPAAADGQGSPGSGSGRSGSSRSPEQIAAEVAEAVVWNYRGYDPEIALSGLAERLEETGQGDSELAEVIDALRTILKRRLPPGRAVS